MARWWPRWRRKARSANANQAEVPDQDPWAAPGSPRPLAIKPRLGRLSRCLYGGTLSESFGNVFRSDVFQSDLQLFVPTVQKDARLARGAQIKARPPFRNLFSESLSESWKRRPDHEARCCHYQTIQTRRGAPGAYRDRGQRHDRNRGQGLRPPKGPHGSLSRRRICREFSAEAANRDRGGV